MERVEIVIDGETVVGEITERWHRYLSIRLGCLSADVSVPWFAIRHTDLTGPRGDEWAVDLLTGLHRKTVLFTRHEDELRRLWNATRERLAAYDATDPAEDLRARKSAARRAFRNGTLTQREYQAIRKGLRKEKEAFDDRRREIIEEFMSSPRPWTEHVDLGQIVTFLERNDPEPNENAEEEGRA